jgi:four helix bundle protein
MASLHEAETHLLIASCLDYISEDTADLLAQGGEIGRLISGLMRSLRAGPS